MLSSVKMALIYYISLQVVSSFVPGGNLVVPWGDIATIVDEAKNILLKYNLYPDLLMSSGGRL